MENKGRGIKYLPKLLAVLVIVGGFYLVLDSVSDVRDDIASLEIKVQLLARGTSLDIDSVLESGDGSDLSVGLPDDGGVGVGDSIIIPTAVIFDVMSSPILQPQSNVRIVLENVSKTKDGDVVLAVRVFTNEATSYSALEIRDLFELVDVATFVNQRPTSVQGGFDSMSPKSVIQGEVRFKINSSKDAVILQINSDDGLIHYEFDFRKETYEEKVLG